MLAGCPNRSWAEIAVYLSLDWTCKISRSCQNFQSCIGQVEKMSLFYVCFCMFSPESFAFKGYFFTDSCFHFFVALMFEAWLSHSGISLMWLVENLFCIVCHGTSQILKTLIHIQRTTTEIINFRKRDHLDKSWERLKDIRGMFKKFFLSTSRRLSPLLFFQSSLYLSGLTFPNGLYSNLKFLCNSHFPGGCLAQLSPIIQNALGENTMDKAAVDIFSKRAKV